jgi:predicted nucleic acid-binding protein
LYLLDTMVLSALRRQQRNPNLVAWLQAVREGDLFLSVITVGEVEGGIAAVLPRDPAFAQRLEVWLDEVMRRFASRILPVDVAAARRWGRLAAAHGHSGADLLIAATALEHGLTVATSNTRHFLGTGVALVDPLAASGSDLS